MDDLASGRELASNGDARQRRAGSGWPAGDQDANVVGDLGGLHLELPIAVASKLNRLACTEPAQVAVSQEGNGQLQRPEDRKWRLTTRRLHRQSRFAIAELPPVHVPAGAGVAR